MKLLLWLILAWVAVLWYTHLKKTKLAAARRADAAASANAGVNAGPAGGSRMPEVMLPCATCGVHLPRSEALVSVDGKLAWCCDEHRQQHQRQAAP